MSSECTHGMPSPKSCTDCMDEGPVVELTGWRQISRPFRAAYDGTCRCGDPILASAHIIKTWARGDESVYMHEECRP